MSHNKQKGRISIRNFVIVMVLFLAAHIFMSVFLISIAKKALQDQADQRMLDLSGTAAHLINGDELEKLTADDTETESYKSIYNLLHSFQESIELDYIYAIQYDGDGTFSYTIDPDDDPAEWGETIETTDALVNAANGTPDVDDEATEDEWGRFYSAYSPIYNSKNEVVGLIGVDFDADWYESMLDTRKLMQVIVPMLSLTIGAGVILILRTFFIERERVRLRSQYERTLQREKKQEQELGSAMQLAYTDPLTGVKNKHSYLEAVERINKGLASGMITEFGVIVFDLNGLKHVNDSLGHEEGDKYIKQGCSLICSRFAHSPVFRIGGDEFVVILEGSDYSEREFLLSEFDRKAEQNHLIGKVVVATGLDIYDDDCDSSFSDVFERADKKMYERKCFLKSLLDDK
ncbi:MAG: diguanylate cyclase [Ruminococcus sp.]|nr:diguanylate cyclase [Ruminococcus sp.]